MPFAGLRDMELATQLSNQLSDYEFEMLLRTRIESTFMAQTEWAKELRDHSHSRCSFSYSWNDKPKWTVAVGTTYADTVDMKGEVLTQSFRDVTSLWNLQTGNKLSNLLPAPTPVVVEATEPLLAHQAPEPSVWDEPV